MITNGAEFRVALQAVLVSILAFSGYWECALVMLLILLPWKPLLAGGGYLTQPLVDWWIDRARTPNQQVTVEVERELDVILKPLKRRPSASTPAAFAKPPVPAMVPGPSMMQSLGKIKPMIAAEPIFQSITDAPHNLSATLAIPPAIQNHVRNLAQGVFSNMDLEVEEVKFDGEMAEAFVKFKSSNVTGLVIRQRYVLRKSGDHWEVESRQSVNGTVKAPLPFEPSDQLPMQLT
jgi:hypothetical protein